MDIGFLRLTDQLNVDENGDIENERLVLCLANKSRIIPVAVRGEMDNIQE